MKRIRKIAIIIFAPILIQLLYACPKCPKRGVSSFEFTDLDITGKRIFLLDSTGKIEDSMSYKHIVLQFGFQFGNFALVPSNALPQFIPTLHAFSCPGFFMQSRDSFTRVSVITIQNYDAQHLAGSDISDIVRFADYQSRGSTQVDSTLAQQFNTALRFQNSGVGGVLRQSLILKKKPQTASEYQFELKCFMSNGRLLQRTTDKIYFR